MNHVDVVPKSRQIGRFKIGWRKRAILLDWSETVGTKTSEELFKDEDVTKDTRMIHAWSLEHAKRYIESIVASASKSQSNEVNTTTSQNNYASQSQN